MRKLHAGGLAGALVLAVGLALPAVAASVPDAIHPLPPQASGEDVRAQLQQLGFTDVGEVEERGNVYRTQARWEGRQVDLRIDARSGGISTDSQIGRSASPVPDSIHPLPPQASVDDVRSQLQRLGFTEVGEVEHRGDVYRTQAKWQERWVDLRIDARSGGITDENADGQAINTMSPVDAEDVRRQLEALGYTNVGPVTSEGNVITTTAMRDGRSVDLRIDARSGAVQVLN